MTKIYVEAEKGVDLLWGNKFDAAEELFESKCNNNPRYALHYGEVAFFRGILSELATDRQQAITRFERAISLAEEHSKYYDSGAIPKGVEIEDHEIPNYALDAHIVAADGYTMLATLQVMEDYRLKGLLNMRRAWKTYRDIIGKLEKSGADAVVHNSLKFGAGLFYFLISMIPPGMAQKAAALAGFRGGDKELGLQYLRDCHNAKSIRSILAGLILALNHLFLTIPFEDDGGPELLAEVNGITNEGLQKYPEGSLFRTFAAVAEMEKGNTKQAREFLESAILHSKEVVNCTPPVFMRLLVNCHAMDQNWAEAAAVLERIKEQEKLIKSKYTWSSCWNYLRLGSCYIMLNENDKAKAHFELVVKEKAAEKWVQDLKQQSIKFIKTGGYYSMFELMYLTGHFYKLIRNVSDEKRIEIINLIEEMAEKAPGSKTPLSDMPRPVQKSRFNVFSKTETSNNPEADNRGAYLVLKGTVLWSMKKYEQCEKLVDEIIDNSEVFANDKLYHVLALIIHARSISHARPSDAIVQLENAMKINHYPWENAQKSMCRRLLEQYGVTEIQTSDADIGEEQVDKILAEEEREDE